MISIIEFAVYGFITYVSLLMLIISVVKETPTGKSQSIIRAMWLIPGIITASLLAGLGDSITMEDTTTTSTLINVNTTETWTETVATNAEITLIDPIWVSIHYMIFAVLLAYVLLQMLTLLTRIGN